MVVVGSWEPHQLCVCFMGGSRALILAAEWWSMFSHPPAFTGNFACHNEKERPVRLHSYCLFWWGRYVFQTLAIVSGAESQKPGGSVSLALSQIQENILLLFHCSSLSLGLNVSVHNAHDGANSKTMKFGLLHTAHVSWLQKRKG